MSRTMSQLPDMRILEDVVAPEQTTMSSAVARAVSSLKFTSRQVAEINRLLDKNNAGTISARERAKLEGYTRVGNFLSLLRAKARASLTQKSNQP